MANTTGDYQWFRDVCCRVFRDEILVDVQCLVRTVAADILLLCLLFMIVDQYRVVVSSSPEWSSRNPRTPAINSVEDMRSIFVKTRTCVISSFAESERMLVSKIQPLVDEL